MPCSASGGLVAGVVAAREQRAVHARVQRLDAAAEHLGDARQVLDARRRPGRARRGRRRCRWSRSARRRARPGPCAKLEQARLVGDRDERSLDRHVRAFLAMSSRSRAPRRRRSTTAGRSRCSDRVDARAQALRTLIVVDRHAAPGRRPARRPAPRRRDARSRPSRRTPAASASSIACAPGNAGSSDGCRLSTRSGKRSRNAAREHAHEARADDELRRSRAASQSAIARVARARGRRVLGEREDGALDARARARARSANASRVARARPRRSSPRARARARSAPARFEPEPETSTPTAHGAQRPGTRRPSPATISPTSQASQPAPAQAASAAGAVGPAGTIAT